MKDYQKERRQLESALTKLIRPHIWESGYGEQGRPYKLWMPMKNGKPTNQRFKLARGFVLQEFYGLGEDGAITYYFAGGLMTRKFSEMPIEDLFRLRAWVERKFGTSAPRITAR